MDVMVLENKIWEVENELHEAGEELRKEKKGGSGEPQAFGHCSCRCGEIETRCREAKALKVKLDLMEVENKGAQVSSGLLWVRGLRLGTKSSVSFTVGSQKERKAGARHASARTSRASRTIWTWTWTRTKRI